MNILFLCPDRNDPTAFYRSSGIAHDLHDKSGHEIITLQWNETSVTWQVLANFDIIMLQRPFTKVAAELCIYAKNMNKRIWIDYDDNLFALNPENKAFITYNDKATQENIKECLKTADVVSVPTEYLRQSYSTYSKNIVLIPNAFNDGIFKRGTLRQREKKVLWRGPESHIYDLMTFGKELNKITEDFIQWEFVFMGYYPWFLSETSNKEFMPGLDIIMYLNKLIELAPSVLHVPLHDNTFNRCRSNIAYIEGSYAGAACVVPAWWNVPGALSYTDAPSYYEAMRLMLSGEVDTRVLNMEAWAYIMDNFRLSKINVLRMEVINSLI